MTEQQFLDRVQALYGAMLAWTYLTPHRRRMTLLRAMELAERERSQPATMFAWVLEREGSPADRPLYWAGSYWSADNLEAVRFSRSADAVAASSLMLGNHRVVEHGWC